MKRSGLCLMGIVALAIAMAGCAGTGKGVSDAEQIDALKVKCAERAMAQDIDGLLAHYSEDFYCGAVGDKEKMRAFLEDAKKSGFLDDVEVSFENAETVIDGVKATMDPVEISGYFGYISATFHAEKRDGQWIITGMDAAL